MDNYTIDPITIVHAYGRYYVRKDVSDRIIASLSEAQTDRFFRAEKTYFNFRTEEVYFDDREVFRSPKDFEDQEVV